MRWIWLAVLAAAFVPPAVAQHHHDHGDAEKKPVERPRIFLDKSPRVVAYQLNRLDNERLLLVERKTDDPKYGPVYKAILARAGMSPQYREEALAALVELNESNGTDEIISAIEDLNAEDRQQRRTAMELARLRLAQDIAAQAHPFAVILHGDQNLAGSGQLRGCRRRRRYRRHRRPLRLRPGGLLGWQQ